MAAAGLQVVAAGHPSSTPCSTARTLKRPCRRSYRTIDNLPQGAFHAADVGFLFRRAALNEAQGRLSATMTAYVSYFVARGDPNRRGLPAWPRYRPPGSGPDRLDDLVQSLVPDAIAPTAGFKADHNCAFWQLVAGTPA